MSIERIKLRNLDDISIDKAHSIENVQVIDAKYLKITTDP